MDLDKDFERLWDKDYLHIFCGYFDNADYTVVPFIMRYAHTASEKLFQFFYDTPTVSDLVGGYRQEDYILVPQDDEDFMNPDTMLLEGIADTFIVVMGVNDDIILTRDGVTTASGKRYDGHEFRKLLLKKGKEYAKRVRAYKAV